VRRSRRVPRYGLAYDVVVSWNLQSRTVVSGRPSGARDPPVIFFLETTALNRILLYCWYYRTGITTTGGHTSKQKEGVIYEYLDERELTKVTMLVSFGGL
jgi:hypothetical protein